MSSSLRRGALAATLALSLSPLAACAAGNDAPTLQVAPNNAMVTAGNIQVQNAVILTQPSGTGTAAVSARIFNKGGENQTLQSVKVGGTTANLTAQDGGQTITVPAHGSVLLGGSGNPVAVIPNGTAALMDGANQNAVFTFSGAGEVSLTLPVLPAVGYYGPYGPSASPSPSATTTPPAKPGSPTGTTTPGATGKPGATAKPAATETPAVPAS